MSAGRVVIELGEVAPLGQPGDALAEPVAGWSAAQRRTAAAVAVLIAVLALVDGAAARPRPMTMAIVATDTRDMILYGSDIQLALSLGDGPGDRTVAGYSMPDARPLWRVPIAADQVGWLTLTRSSTALVISEEGPSPDGQSAAVLAGTGRVLYRAGGQLLGLLPGGHVLLWTSRGGEFGVEAGGRRLVARALATGRAQWSYTAPPGAWLWWDPRDGDLAAVAVLLPSGRLEMRDLPGGELTAAADLLAPRRPAQPPDGVQIAGDLLLVEGWQGGRVRVTAYGRHRLDRRWAVDMDLASEFVTPCAGLLCVGSLARGIRVLDPATGDTRWSSDQWSFVEPVGDYLLAGPAGARVGGTGLVVLDPRTGRVRADLGNWSPVWPLPAEGAPIAVRHDLRSSRSWFGRIDARDGRVRVIGVVTGVTDDCRAGVGWVSCRRPDGGVSVWRLPATG